MKFFFLNFLPLIFSFQAFHIEAKTQRVGLAAAVPIGIALTYDEIPGFKPHWSLGGEVAGVDDDYVYLAVRSFYWQYRDNMSGFYGGPKLGFALGTKIGAAIGAEGGWNYRFENSIDVGAALELWASYGAYGGVRLNAGYAF